MRPMISTLFGAAAIAAVIATPALASGPKDGSTLKGAGGETYLDGSVMTYELFEESIMHVDLEHCPPEFDPEVVFCRMTLAADRAHVFVFALDGDQPLLAVKHYDLDDAFLHF